MPCIVLNYGTCTGWVETYINNYDLVRSTLSKDSESSQEGGGRGDLLVLGSFVEVTRVGSRWRWRKERKAVTGKRKRKGDMK